MRLGEARLRSPNPVVATYARADAVDVRISAIDEDGPGARRAAVIVDAEADAIRSALPGRVWAEGDATWGEVVGGALAKRGWRLATVEAGTRGALAALLADAPALRRATTHDDDAAGALIDGDALLAVATAAAREAGTEVGVALGAVPEGGDLRAHVAIVAPGTKTRLDRLVFLAGPQGRLRAAVVAAFAVLDATGAGPGRRSSSRGG